jgi:DNA-binding response OmpR family regulator
MTVLMLGRQLELGYYRAVYLQSHGFQVIFPENKNAAFAAIRAGGFDAVIISYTLSKVSAKEFVSLIKQLDKDCPVVAITQRGWEEEDFECDEKVLDVDRPPALLEALLRIAKRTRERQQ